MFSTGKRFFFLTGTEADLCCFEREEEKTQTTLGMVHLIFFSKHEVSFSLSPFIFMRVGCGMLCGDSLLCCASKTRAKRPQNSRMFWHFFETKNHWMVFVLLITATDIHELHTKLFIYIWNFEESWTSTKGVSEKKMQRVMGLDNGLSDWSVADGGCFFCLYQMSGKKVINN